MENIINRKTNLTKSQKDDLIHETFQNIIQPYSLEYANLVLDLYNKNVFFNYKTPYTLLKRLSSESNTIRKNTRNYIETYFNDFIKYKTVNLKKIEEFRKNDDNPPTRPKNIVKRKKSILKKKIISSAKPLDFETMLSNLPDEILMSIFSFEPRDRDMKSKTADLITNRIPVPRYEINSRDMSDAMRRASRHGRGVYVCLNEKRHAYDILRNGFKNDYVPAINTPYINRILNIRNYFITFERQNNIISSSYDKIMDIIKDRFYGDLFPPDFKQAVEQFHFEYIRSDSIYRMGFVVH